MSVYDEVTQAIIAELVVPSSPKLYFPQGIPWCERDSFVGSSE